MNKKTTTPKTSDGANEPEAVVETPTKAKKRDPRLVPPFGVNAIQRQTKAILEAQKEN